MIQSNLFPKSADVNPRVKGIEKSFNKLSEEFKETFKSFAVDFIEKNPDSISIDVIDAYEKTSLIKPAGKDKTRYKGTGGIFQGLVRRKVLIEVGTRKCADKIRPVYRIGTDSAANQANEMDLSTPHIKHVSNLEQ